MQAIVQRRYGIAPEDVLRLEQIARPAIKAGEVLVRVRAAGVDRGTWHLMAGHPYLMRVVGFGLRGPKTPVPGWAVAGTVEAVGRDVTGLEPGDEVFGTGLGSFAQYATAQASRVAPAGQPDLRAGRGHARLGHHRPAGPPGPCEPAARTARPGHRRVRRRGHVRRADRQGPRRRGTGVSSPAKTDLVQAVGADHVLDYTREDPVSGRRHYDVIIDIGGNRRLAHLRRALAPGGTLVITGGEDSGRWLGGIGRNLRAQVLSLFVGQKLTAFVARQRRADLMTLRDLADSGAITPAIDRTYPLAQAAAAVRHLAEGRARGKVVVSL